MNYIQRNEEALKKQIIPQTKQADFEEFWAKQVKILRAVPLKVEKRLLDLPYKTFKAYEIVFNAHDDTKVTAYYCVPNTYTGEKLPCIAMFHGGGGYYNVSSTINLEIVASGYCTFCMDGRSQGGLTYDNAGYDMADDCHGGLMSHGLLNKENFYMRNLYLDAVRSIDVIETLPEVNAQKIITQGISQGGALSIVAAALSGKVIKAYPTVPSYACLEKRVERGSGVFNVVNYYLTSHPEQTDIVMENLSYFDINNMVSLLKVPVHFALGLADPICIPQFVYSPYAHTTAPKQITISPFTPHSIAPDYRIDMIREFATL